MIENQLKELDLKAGEYGQVCMPYPHVAQALNELAGKYILVTILQPPYDMPILVIKRVDKEDKKAKGAE